MSCIDVPVSWLRLEQHAIARDATVAAHLDACAACRSAFAEITGDLVALPPLRMPVPATPRRRRWVIPSFAAFAAAAAIAALIVIARPAAPRAPNVVAWKGGELVLGLVRERHGAIVEDATTYRPGDRWKVVLTCAPGETITGAMVEVFELGPGAQVAPDRPLATASIACGNRVALPGAFSITGARPNRICVRLDRGESACLTVSAE